MRTLLLEAGPKRSKRPQRNETGFDIEDDIYHAADRLTSATGLGGTSERWGGQCVELDDIDFEARDYVAHSGWPIAHEEISPFYQRARALLSSNVAGERSEPEPETDFPSSRESWTRIRNTAKANSAELASSKNLFVALDARIKALAFDPVEARVHSMSIACRGGSYKVCADQYVLACGGRGNTRLLLNLQLAFPELFGGSDGPLGRFYMGHLAGQIAQIEFATKEHAERYLFKRTSTGTFVCNRFQPAPNCNGHTSCRISLFGRRTGGPLSVRPTRRSRCYISGTVGSPSSTRRHGAKPTDSVTIMLCIMYCAIPLARPLPRWGCFARNSAWPNHMFCCAGQT